MNLSSQCERGMHLRTSFLAGVILLTGCSTASRQVRIPHTENVENRQLPTLESAEIGQVSLPLNPADVETALQLERSGVRNGVWPSAIVRAKRTAQRGTNNGGLSMRITTPGTSPESIPPEPSGESETRIHVFSSDFHQGRTQRLAMNDRVFYFLMAPPGLKRTPNFDSTLTRDEALFAEPTRRFVVVAVEEGVNPGIATFVTEGEPPTIYENVTPRLVAPFAGRSDFAVVPWKDGAAVIYRDQGGIYMRRLNIDGDVVAFQPERRKIADAPDAISHYQLVARMDASGTVHLLWAIRASEEEGSLHYCRLMPQAETLCRRPIELSPSLAIPGNSNPINLMLQGKRVYANWIDTRYKGGVWTRRNYAKLFVAASQDSGKTFNTPVSVNRPQDDSNNANYALTLPATEGGVLVFWTTETIQGGSWQNLPFHVGWLDANLERLQLGIATISGPSLYDGIMQNARRYQEHLGR